MFNSLDALNGGKASCLTTDCVPQEREREAAESRRSIGP